LVALVLAIRLPARTFLLILGVPTVPNESNVRLVITARTLPAATLVCLALLVPTLAAEPATAGSKRPDGFHAGRVYRGSFPDPDVFRLGHLWVALSTTIARRSLPMMTSHDGRTWRARAAHGHGGHRTNDALVGVPAWSARHPAGARRFVPSWAPSVGRTASGRWIAAYAAPLRRHPGRRCVGVARSRHALGPFKNARERPLVCLPHQSAIDPEVFRSGHRTFLLWKTEGIPGRVSSTLRIRPLARSGLRFQRGSRAHTLLRTARGWEGPVIENPSMIRFHGRLYLFYSGNRWYSRHYAIGYALCRTVHGPCRRPQRGPLLASGRGVAGPGGESAFRGPRGQLMLAYAAWPSGRVGHERRLHVATLHLRKHGRLSVARRYRHR